MAAFRFARALFFVPNKGRIPRNDFLAYIGKLLET